MVELIVKVFPKQQAGANVFVAGLLCLNGDVTSVFNAPGDAVNG